MRRVAPLLLAALAACGDGDGPPAATWSFARVEGMPGATDLALRGDELYLVAGGNDRNVYLVRRADLKAGGTARARAIPMEAVKEARIVGGVGDDFSRAGYRIGDTWDAPVDMQGIAVQEPDAVFVGERTYRIVYWGRFERGADGLPVRARLDQAFPVPGAERPGKDRSDWRDTSRGLGGLLSVAEEGKSADLVCVERRGTDDSRFRLWRLDRVGIAADWMEARVPKETKADVGGIARDGDRFVVVRGPGAGSLHRLRQGKPYERAELPPGEAGPAKDGVGPWLGIARSPDRTLFLASGGAACWIAWRIEPAAAPD